MTVSTALQEAYASGDTAGVVLTAAEIDHASFEAPIRIVTGIDMADPDATVLLPLEEGGAKVPHVPCGFTFVRPGHDRDGPTDAKVSIDNVSDLLQGHLRAALGYNLPVTITFRQYIVSPGQLAAVTGPDELIDGLLLRKVDLWEDRAEGTLSWPDGRQANVPTGPNAFFDTENYPALFGR